jgi:group I intron endonuclease
MTSGIYCIENNLNRKKYIGKSIDMERRFYYHKTSLNKNSHFNKYLQNSWNKYGEENFTFYILEESDKEKINRLEIYYINLYNTKNQEFGFNLTDGGEGMLGHIPSDETRLKRSVALLGRGLSEERKKNISIATTGKRTGNKNPNYGKHPSEETRYKIGNAMRNKKHSEKTKQEWKKNRKYTSGQNHYAYGTKHKKESNYFCVYKKTYDGKYVSWVSYFREC